MNIADILILAAIAAGVFFAVRSYKKSGGCSGDCSNCRRSCKK